MQLETPSPSPSTKVGRRPKWIYSVLPINIAMGPIGTMVQLYLIQLNGTALGTIYAGLAVGIFNAVTIPASIFWGFASDRLHARKAIIVASFGGASITFLLFLLAPTTPGTIAIYATLAFITTAEATPLNLLIMESEPKSSWASTLASLSLIISVGNTLGLVISSVWVEAFPILLMVVPFAGLSFVSVGLALKLIKEPSYVFERGVMIRQKQSLLNRVLAVPQVFVSIPRLMDFQKIFSGLRFEMTSYVPLLYISIGSFYFAGGLFNTSIVSALSAFSFSGAQVFLVTLAVMIVQIAGFGYADRYIRRRGTLLSAMITSLAIRGICYGLLGFAAFLIPNFSYLIPVLILYPVASGLAYAVYYTSSNTVVFNSIQNRSHGSAMGVYSAVVGIATTVGSLVSGFVSFYLGFHVTFVVAGLFLGLSAVIASRLRQLKELDTV